MKMLLSFLTVLCLSLSSVGAQDFPGDYLGKWAGELEIFNPEGLQQKVPMQLHIIPVDDSTYTYTIIYGEDIEKGKRDYLLRAGKDGPHHWVIDEQDGILLDNFYVGNVLGGPFSVNGTILYANLEFRGEQLYYTISGGKTDPYSKSGTTDEESGQEYKVESFEVSFYQKAYLNKM